MPLVFNNDRWDSILILLNEKRVAKGFSTISHTFSGWVKQSDIDCLRNGLIEILSSYGYTLATALAAAGYGYSTWKTWTYNWIAEVSLDEIEDILNILVSGVSQISVHCHNPEEKEINSIEGMITSTYAIIYTKLHSSPTWINKGYSARNAGEHPKNIELTPGTYDVKIIFNGITLEQDNIIVNNTVILTFNFTRIDKTSEIFATLNESANAPHILVNSDVLNREDSLSFIHIVNDLGEIYYYQSRYPYTVRGIFDDFESAFNVAYEWNLSSPPSFRHLHLNIDWSYILTNLEITKIMNDTVEGLTTWNYDLNPRILGYIIRDYVISSSQSFTNWFIQSMNTLPTYPINKRANIYLAGINKYTVGRPTVGNFTDIGYSLSLWDTTIGNNYVMASLSGDFGGINWANGTRYINNNWKFSSIPFDLLGTAV